MSQTDKERVDRFLNAMQLKERGLFHEAAAEISAVLTETDRADERAHLLLNLAWIKNLVGNLVEARKCIQAATELVPEDEGVRASAAYHEAYNLFSEHKNSEALTALRQIVSKHNSYLNSTRGQELRTEVHRMTGLILVHMEDYAAAESELKHSINAGIVEEEKQVETLYSLAICYVHLQQPEKATSTFLELLNHSPSPNFQARTHYDLGLLLFKEQRYADALGRFQMASELVGQSDVPPDFIDRMISQTEQMLGGKRQVQ